MCAECHSTNLRKGYRADGDRYETTWSEIDVACESCHGPGSEHVAWARAAGAKDRGRDARRRFAPASRSASWCGCTTARSMVGRWIPRPAPCGEPRRRRHDSSSRPARGATRVAGLLDERYVNGRPLLDTHRPALLDQGLYFADGQIRDEVYEYGSFLQSRMHAAGVTCSDCHDPHSLELLATGDALCARCHAPERFAVETHHHHPVDSAGARCVECHMPERTYMVIDRRRDHSLRLPRPDLEAVTGAPDACTACHRDRDAAWAARAIEGWGVGPRPPHWGEIIAAAWRGEPGVDARLLKRRAGETPSRRSCAPPRSRCCAATADPERPRGAASTALPTPTAWCGWGRCARSRARGAEQRAALLASVAPRSDARRAHRRRAPAGGRSGVGARRRRRRRSRSRARGVSRVAGGRRRSSRGAPQSREPVVGAGRPRRRRARVPARRSASIPRSRPRRSTSPTCCASPDATRRRPRCCATRWPAIPTTPRCTMRWASLWCGLGRQPEALVELERAAAAAPDEPRYAYVLGVALHSMGKTDQAVAVLERTHRRAPADADVLAALASIERERGRAKAALAYARKLAALDPSDPGARALVTSSSALAPSSEALLRRGPVGLEKEDLLPQSVSDAQCLERRESVLLELPVVGFEPLHQVTAPSGKLLKTLDFHSRILTPTPQCVGDVRLLIIGPIEARCHESPPHRQRRPRARDGVEAGAEPARRIADLRAGEPGHGEARRAGADRDRPRRRARRPRRAPRGRPGRGRSRAAALARPRRRAPASRHSGLRTHSCRGAARELEDLRQGVHGPPRPPDRSAVRGGDRRTERAPGGGCDRIAGHGPRRGDEGRRSRRRQRAS